MRKLFQTMGIYLSSNMMAALVPFVFLPILARYLTKEEFGQVAIFQTLVALLVPIISFNCLTFSTRHFYDKHLSDEDKCYYNDTCLLIFYVFSFVIFSIFFLFDGYLKKILSLDVNWILLAVLSAFFQFLFRFRLAHYQVREKALPYGFLQVSFAIISFFSSILLILSIDDKSFGRVLGIFIPSLFFGIFSYYSLIKGKVISFNIKVSVKRLRIILLYSIPLMPHVICGFLLASLDRLIINNKLGLSYTGVYMLALQVSMGMGIFFDAINKAFSPWLFKNLEQRNMVSIRNIIKGTYLFYILLLILGLSSYFWGPYLVSLIGGDKYREAESLIGFLIMGQIFSGMYLMITNYLIFEKKNKHLSFITLLTVIVYISSFYLLISAFGLVGAGYAYLFSMAFRFLMTLFFSFKLIKLPWFLM